MKDSQPRSEDKPSPSSSTKPAGGAPIGTHSLTGGGVNVGIPSGAPEATNKEAGRSSPRDVSSDSKDEDADSKPRDDVGETLGRKP